MMAVPIRDRQAMAYFRDDRMEESLEAFVVAIHIDCEKHYKNRGFWDFEQESTFGLFRDFACMLERYHDKDLQYYFPLVVDLLLRVGFPVPRLAQMVQIGMVKKTW